MAKLIYVINMSLDGFIEDQEGSFNWSEPGDQTFAFITDLIRPVGTHLLGRKMYEMMAVWETDPSFAAASELMADFANVWQGADKVVFSTTLDVPLTARTRPERSFDPDVVRKMKGSDSRDLAVAGPNLAAQAFTAGLVDEVHLFVHPVFIGGGKPALPTDTRASLELLDERRFGDGCVYLRYLVQPSGQAEADSES
jgi:dihydrofolate reductase